MQDENIMKMAEFADTEIKDIPTLNILLCYLMYKIGKPVETEQLYDISIGTGIINYFFYQDSIDYLLKNGLFSIEKNDTGTDCYVITPKGLACAKQLKSYAPKSYRDKLVVAALRYLAKLKYEQEVKISYIAAEKGVYVCIKVIDVSSDLMDMKLFAPDMTQAKLIGKRIMLNPAGFYGKVMELAIGNEEVPLDMTDN